MRPPKVLLTLKHWQLFLVFAALAVGAAFVQLRLLARFNPRTDIRDVVVPLFAFTYVFLLIYLGWFWALGEFLFSRSPESQRPNIRLFRLALLYPLGYVPYFAAFLIKSAGNPTGIALIFPLHLLALGCLLYDMYFIAKSLKLAEHGRAFSFRDFAAEFFLLWFYPIGIWVLQPRVNRLAASADKESGVK